MSEKVGVAQEVLNAGDRLAEGLAKIRRMLYGLCLTDPRQAWLAQKAIDEAVDAQREWNEARKNADLSTNGEEHE
jgi:hypothetical protein